MSETAAPTPADGPGISDDQLPEDLQPTDDNPLAKNPEGSRDGGLSPGNGDVVPPSSDA